MHSLMTIHRNLLASFLLISLSHAAWADDRPGLKPDDKPVLESVESRKQKRRDDFRKLEEYTQSLRSQLAAELVDAKAGQDLLITQAEQEFQKAGLARLAAQYTLQEYEEGVLRQAIATAQGEVALTGAALSRGKKEWEVLQRMKKDRKPVHEYDYQRGQLTLQLLEFDSDQAEAQLEVLVEYTGPNEVKRLKALIVAAQNTENEKQGLWKLEQTKGEKLAASLKRLDVRAPEDFVIALINDAVKCEEQVIALSRDAQAIASRIEANPTDAGLLDQLRQKRGEAEKLMGQAKAQLAEATRFAEHVRSQRIKLAEAETLLKKERAILEATERIPAPAL